MARRLSWALPLGLLLAATCADARLINVDFNSSVNTPTSPTYSGPAVLGAAGDTWNGVTAGSFQVSPVITNLSLVDSGNQATATTLSLTKTAPGFRGGAPTTGCTFAADLLCDYLYANNTTVTFTLGGLTTGQLYDLILYSVPSTANGRTSTFKLDSTTKAAATPAGTTPQNTTSFTEGLNYVRFGGTVGATGILSFELIGGQFGTEGNLNGFQLDLKSSSVPEPAGIGLALAGLGAAAAARRRRSRS